MNLIGDILVTGGAGFIGSHVVDGLIDDGLRVIVVDRENANLKNSRAIYFRMDLNSPNLESVFLNHGISHVIHLAAQASVQSSMVDPLQDARDNILATINLLDQCRKHRVKKIIAASSAAVYGDPHHLPVDESHPTTFLSPYALSKITMENYIKLFGIDYIILRYSNVYGPGQNSKGEAGVVSIFIDRILKGENVEIFGDGEQIRDFLHVHDVAQINLIALKSDVKNQTVNFSTNVPTSINELFKIIGKNANYHKNAVYRGERQGDIKKSILSNSMAIELFQFSPQINIEAGIRQTLLEEQRVGCKK
jgi:UDP-glucose 4-epimerase